MKLRYKKTSAVTDVGLLPIKVYHRSKDVQCYRISLLITIIILVISILVNISYFYKNFDKSKNVCEVIVDEKEVTQ